ncbi:MAG TPA: biotin/lipoyl-containing protein [Stellaceae bacterium]|nr:biotin/lipoyl-containing protein [Stellaceae bacterium]
MIYKLVVPGPIEDVEEVRVLEWHGKSGRTFEPGELIVELETYKAIVEVRAAQRGILREMLCAAGEWQKVGLPLAVMSDDGAEALPDSLAAAAELAVEFEIN